MAFRPSSEGKRPNDNGYYNYNQDSDLSDEISAALSSFNGNSPEPDEEFVFDLKPEAEPEAYEAPKRTPAPAKRQTTAAAPTHAAKPRSASANNSAKPRSTTSAGTAGKVPAAPKKPAKKTMAQRSTAHAKPVKKVPKLKLFVMPALMLYLELMVRITTGLGFTGLIGSFFHAIAYGCFLTVFCMITSKRKTNRIITLVLMELFTIWFLIAHFCNDAYKVFMGFSIIFGEAGNVVKGFGSTLVRIFTKGFPIILLYHLPVLAMYFFRMRFAYTTKRRVQNTAVLLVLCLCFGLVGYFCNTITRTGKAKYTSEYTYDTAVRRFGVLTALQLDVRYTLFGNPADQAGFEISETNIGTTTPDEPTPEGNTTESEGGESGDPAVAEPETPIVYGDNVIASLDFESLIANCSDSTIKSMHQYVASLEPSKQNKYTGVFEGKNLILITAEAFSKECIDPKLTPTLYKMMNEGILFEDFYQPAWGGSTSTGEYSFVTGLVPTSSSDMKKTIGKNMYFTLGNQLQRLNYYSIAYHNGEYTYYSRNETHLNLGYSSYVAIGNGMEEGVTKAWPRSDLEMMQWTLPQYIDKQPFSVYYMSISGHCNYSTMGNNMSKKNIDAVADLPYSDTVKAYLAANLELEYAMKYLIRELEKAGIADDTVIAICPDHYPYGLDKGDSWGNDEDYLSELYGFNANETVVTRDHSIAILWSDCMNDWDERVVISTPSYSLDLVPTLSNLFGTKYDSRLLVGRDVLSDATPLVLWNDYKWLTDKGYYNGSKFTPNPGVTVDDDYVSRIKSMVGNKITFSKNVLAKDYYRVLFGEDNIK